MAEKFIVPGREDFLVESDYFMSLACLTAMRSRDPQTQVGACIVTLENRVIGVGCNTMPNGCEGQFPWAREADDELNTKYIYVCHAELNAIMNTNGADLKGCTLFVTLCPCNECAKLIIQSGIKSVVYLSDKYKTINSFIAGRRMLKTAGVVLREFQPTSPGKTIAIDFKHDYNNGTAKKQKTG